MIKVSIIIPVYNIEKYLRECLDSAVNQTLENIEIICINDGSKDGSIDILKEYEEKYDKLTVINQENRGLGATRNRGMKEAKGKYIYFLDSDDYIALNTMELCYEKCKIEGVDFVTFDCNTFYENDYIGNYRHSVVRHKSLKRNLYSGYEMFNNLIENNSMYYETCFNFFKKDFLEKFDITYRENLIYEDVVNTVKSYMCANKIYYIREKLYNRRIRNGSIMTNKKTEKNVNAHFICANELYELYKAKKTVLDRRTEINFKKCISNFYSYAISNCYIIKKDNYVIKIKENIKNNRDLKDIYLDMLIDCPKIFNY